MEAQYISLMLYMAMLKIALFFSSTAEKGGWGFVVLQKGWVAWQKGSDYLI
jgi:hypothetical protein